MINRFLSISLILISLNYCNPNYSSNVCDPNSDSFSNLHILKILSKDISPVCSSANYISKIVLFNVSGQVSGLTSPGLKLSLNNINFLEIDANAREFSFENVLQTESSFNVKIENHPSGFTCNVLGGSGTIINSNINSIEITCAISCNPCHLFLTNSGYSPNPGSAKNFDSSCASDSNYPGTGSYKAMVVDGVSRQASFTANAGDNQIDWVFAPNRTYNQIGGTIGTTNSVGLFITTLTNPFSTNSKYWTGLNADWTTNASNTCNLWSSNSGSFTGIMGQGNSTSIASITSGWPAEACNLSNQQLICVEQ